MKGEGQEEGRGSGGGGRLVIILFELHCFSFRPPYIYNYTPQSLKVCCAAHAFVLKHACLNMYCGKYCVCVACQ